MNVPCINLAGQLNLRELAGLLKGAAVCVVNDSSPMHIAAAVGTPTIALFGLTDPIRWAPRGIGHCVISRDCPCRPYGHRRECPEGDNWCMRKISVDKVYEAVEHVMSTCGHGP
jgi:ADP-heptose:LPS heptosyltransferase